MTTAIHKPKLNNMFKIPFTQNQAKKILSQDDLRPALTGVYFDHTERSFILTDGHLLAKVPAKGDALPEESLIIPVEALPGNKKESEQAYYNVIERVDEHGGTDQVILKKFGQVLAEYKPMHMKYVNWRSVWPEPNDRGPVEIIGINFSILARLESFLKFEMKEPKLKLEFTEPGRAIVFELNHGKASKTLEEFNYKVTGLIMPMFISKD